MPDRAAAAIVGAVSLAYAQTSNYSAGSTPGATTPAPASDTTTPPSSTSMPPTTSTTTTSTDPASPDLQPKADRN